MSEDVAAAAVAWLAAPSDAGAERRFADALEVELARRLAQAGWPLSGRWFDGLIIDEHRVTASGVAIRGQVWTIEQRRLPFSAVLSASGAPRTASIAAPDGETWSVSW